jgi:GT2 family glycosyltransferase
MYKYDLTVVIVAWNVAERLRENLRSLRQTDQSVSFEVVVVDNASSDLTVEMLKKDFSEVTVIANETNLGFARANNQAVKLAQGKHILLLNPDMRVFPDTLSKMFAWFERHPQAAVAGCKLVTEAGAIVPHVRRFPRLADQLAIVLKIPHLLPAVLNSYLVRDFNYELEGKVDSVRGSFFLLRRIGEHLPLLDERYFVWFEEVDYCRQVRGRGLEVWYTPVAQCVDFVGGSFNQLKRGTTQDYFRDSMLKYFKKWQPSWQYYILLLAWPLGRSLALVGALIKIRTKAKT